MVEPFRKLSPEFRALLDEARCIAIELGCDFIGTEHVFLADCRLNGSASMRSFAKLTDSDFLRLLDRFRKGDSCIFLDTLPITMDVERTIRKASELRQSYYYPDRELRPYHYFLAAGHLRNTNLSRILETKTDLVHALEQFYLGEYLLNQERINRNWKARLRSRIRNMGM